MRRQEPVPVTVVIRPRSTWGSVKSGGVHQKDAASAAPQGSQTLAGTGFAPGLWLRACLVPLSVFRTFLPLDFPQAIKPGHPTS